MTKSNVSQSKNSKKVYCICKTDWSDKRFMIKCDKCHEWYHGDCLPEQIQEKDAQDYLIFHCFKCVDKHGPCIMQKDARKSAREHGLVDYKQVINELKYKKLLETKRFIAESFPRVNGNELDIEYAKKTGLTVPVIVTEPQGLGMRMPPSSLKVRDVAESCGMETRVEVLKVSTQSEEQMSLQEWTEYFELPLEERKEILNVISLEISRSSLGKSIKRPKIVRQIDWIDHVWTNRRTFPRVQLYCLMSVSNSYTDFHIDFGGSSVFYHVLSGEKHFYFVEPTLVNLKKYERWSDSQDQSNVFFGDLVKECIKVVLYPGNTMIIPSGWIHSVFTPMDSIVIGGNFLHGFSIKKQLEIAQIEERTQVPLKFRFPDYLQMQWHAANYYSRVLCSNPDDLTSSEVDGVWSLVKYLRRYKSKKSNDALLDSIEEKLKLINHSSSDSELVKAKLQVLEFEEYMQNLKNDCENSVLMDDEYVDQQDKQNHTMDKYMESMGDRNMATQWNQDRETGEEWETDQQVEREQEVGSDASSSQEDKKKRKLQKLTENSSKLKKKSSVFARLSKNMKRLKK